MLLLPLLLLLTEAEPDRRGVAPLLLRPLTITPLPPAEVETEEDGGEVAPPMVGAAPGTCSRALEEEEEIEAEAEVAADEKEAVEEVVAEGRAEAVEAIENEAVEDTGGTEKEEEEEEAEAVCVCVLSSSFFCAMLWLCFGCSLFFLSVWCVDCRSSTD